MTGAQRIQEHLCAERSPDDGVGTLIAQPRHPTSTRDRTRRQGARGDVEVGAGELVPVEPADRVGAPSSVDLGEIAQGAAGPHQLLPGTERRHAGLDDGGQDVLTEPPLLRRPGRVGVQEAVAEAQGAQGQRPLPERAPVAEVADLDAAAADVDDQPRIDGQPVDRTGEHVARLRVAVEDLQPDPRLRRNPGDELPAVAWIRGRPRSPPPPRSAAPALRAMARKARSASATRATAASPRRPWAANSCTSRSGNRASAMISRWPPAPASMTLMRPEFEPMSMTPTEGGAGCCRASRLTATPGVWRFGRQGASPRRTGGPRPAMSAPRGSVSLGACNPGR